MPADEGYVIDELSAIDPDPAEVFCENVFETISNEINKR
jgi:hypothetical protein